MNSSNSKKQPSTVTSTSGPTHHHAVKYLHGSVDDVLKPTLMSLGDGRCYRKLDVTFGGTEAGETASHSAAWTAVSRSNVHNTGEFTSLQY